MLVIGHRGAAGLAPENTMQALQAGYDADADMLEFDVRLTRDRVPIIIHDFHTLRTHKKASIVRFTNYEDLRKKVGTKHEIAKLETVLNKFFGRIILNIEVKSDGSAAEILDLIRDNYIKKPSDWDAFVLSSFKAHELSEARRVSKRVNLALLQSENPFAFIGYQRKLKLTAVGFHRLYVNKLALEIAKRAHIFTYVYTVNRPQAALLLDRQGVDGIVTNYPDRILSEVNKHQS